jgi:hypothetical protein
MPQASSTRGPAAALDELGVDSAETIEALTALQIHHSVHTAVKVYGCLESHVSGLATNQQQALVDFSLRFHEFFGMAPNQFTAFGELYFSKIPRGMASTIYQNQGLARASPMRSDALVSRAKHVHMLSQPEATDQVPKRVRIQELATYLSNQGSRADSFEPPPSPDSTPMPDAADLDLRDLLRSGQSESIGLASPREDPLLAIFRQFTGDPQAQFKSTGQCAALFYMLRRVPELFVILPTAGGKTTLFLLAGSLATAHVSLIVVPLVALKLDLFNKAVWKQVPVSVWESLYGDTPATSLVLISIESIKHSQFFSWCQRLIGQGLLDRIILDECHVIPSSRGY